MYEEIQCNIKVLLHFFSICNKSLKLKLVCIDTEVTVVFPVFPLHFEATYVRKKNLLTVV